MEKHIHSTVESEDGVRGNAFFAAESVRRDFSELVALFQWHLDALGSSNCQARAHISEAKAAAERGLELSSELVESVKASDLRH